MMVPCEVTSGVVAAVMLTASVVAHPVTDSGPASGVDHGGQVSAAQGAAANPPELGHASGVTLPCIPVGAYWVGPEPPAGTPAGPGLAVVSLQVRPKDARVHLDGEFIGRARFFNGNNGFLFLEPGVYQIELRHQKHQTLTVALDAEANCRYRLKHRLERAPRGSQPADTYGDGRPVLRVFSPTEGEGRHEPVKDHPRPDTSLRPDLGDSPPTASQAPGAALELRISPDDARVSIDGVFVATGEELAAMEGPLASSVGVHRLSVEAAGHIPWSREVVLEVGETLLLEIVLEPQRER